MVRRKAVDRNAKQDRGKKADQDRGKKAEQDRGKKAEQHVEGLIDLSHSVKLTSLLTKTYHKAKCIEQCMVNAPQQAGVDFGGGCQGTGCSLSRTNLLF